MDEMGSCCFDAEGAQYAAALECRLTEWDPVTFDPDRHHRRSIRLHGFDYSQPGSYFLTVCTKDRALLFGTVVDGVMHLNDVGQIVESVWHAMPAIYPGVETDAFVVMPNHVHGILALTGGRVAALGLDSDAEMGAINRAPTLGTVIRGFKASITAAVNKHRGTMGEPVWQRNYYEHIIRDEASLARIRQYILENPAQWSCDGENPESRRRR